MSTIEVGPADWTQFFDGFSRRLRGVPGRLTVLDPKLGAQVEAEALAIQGIVADSRGRGIAILLGASPDELEHAVRLPRRVWVETADEECSATSAIEIESADGTRVILEFCGVAPPGVDEGGGGRFGAERRPAGVAGGVR